MFVQVCGWAHSSSEGVVFGIAACLSCTTPLLAYVRINELYITSFGQIIVTIIIFQDLLMCIILAMPELLVSASMLELAYVLTKSLSIFIIVLLIAFLLHRYVVVKLLRLLIDSQRLVLLVVVSICLGMSWLTDFLGLSFECGAFLAGLAFVGTEGLEIALISIQCLDHLFGSIFFSCVGMIISPEFLWQNAVQIIVMVVMVSALKLVSSLILLRQFSDSLAKAFHASLSLTQVRNDRCNVDRAADVRPDR